MTKTAIKKTSRKLFQRNIIVLSAISFFIYFLPYVAVAVIIFEKLTGSYIEAMSVFALMNITSSLLEIPSGVLSDKIGRKRTLTLGCTLSLINVICLSFALHSDYALWFLYGAAITQGAASSLYSGNNDAILHETLASIRQTRAYPKLFGRMSSLTTAGLALSSLIASVLLLYGLSFDILIYASLVTCSALVLLTLFITEPAKHKNYPIKSLKHITDAFKMINKNPRLKLYSIINIIQGGGGSANYYFIPGFIGSVWAIWAVPVFRLTQHAIGSLSLWHTGEIINRFGASKILTNVSFFMNALPLIGFWIANIFSPIILLFAEPFAASWTTAKSTIEQEAFTQKQRATMGSLINLGSNAISAILSLLIGWMADNMSIGMTLFIVLAIRSIIVSTGYSYIYKHHK